MSEQTYPARVIDAQGKEKIYQIKKCSWLDDAGLTAGLNDAQGKPVFKEIWIARLARDVVGITEKELRTMDRQTFSTLIIWWTEYNEPNPQSFLASSPPTAEDSKPSNSTS